MGSSPSQISSSPINKKIKNKSITKPQIILQEQQPQKSTIAKWIVKEIDIPNLPHKYMKKDVQELKEQILLIFQTKFLYKVSKSQIKLLFTQQSKNSKIQTSKISNQPSVRNLQHKSKLDLQIYKQICKLRFITIQSKMIKQQKQKIETQQQFIKFKQTFNQQLMNCMMILLAQIQGKTQIWSSLNLSYDHKIIKMINFLHEEGIDANKFNVLKQKQLNCN